MYTKLENFRKAASPESYAFWYQKCVFKFHIVKSSTRLFLLKYLQYAL